MKTKIATNSRERQIYARWLLNYMVQFPKLDADKKLKISYAVYSYFVDNNRNYKLSFIPFVILKLKNNIELQRLEDIQRYLLSEYGLFIPRTPLQEIIGHTLKSKFIKIDEKKSNAQIFYYYLSQEGLVESNKYNENKINAKLETFYKDVMEFLIRKSQQSKTPKKNLSPITF